ncbi:uncharacterized protein NPIL_447741 [Nephila pilipes]|uniref:Uncharacterized protein n=1 Tax=Nephila pilipes TaxID=299642 RepID=A0A8X6N6K8_NEPPI|nr:uncharacterized protein NPIL_447741 [Nephila pilipes]
MEEHFWINPLNLEDEVDGNNPSIDKGSETRRQRSAECDPVENINSFLRNAQIAFDQIEDLKTYMTEVQYPELDPESLSSHRIEFLKVPEELQTDNNEALKEVLHHLQKFAVALFQILREAEAINKDDEYYKKLTMTKNKMVQMLGDIQLAILTSDLTPHQDVTYDMLPSHMRNKRGYSLRALRDYMVMRDYSKFLQDVLAQKDTLFGLRP